MNAHPDLDSWAQEWTAAHPTLVARPMFGSPAWFLEGKLRLCVIGPGLALKGTPEAAAGVREVCPWAGPFIAHGRSMGPAWVYLTPPDPSHPVGLDAWVSSVVFSGPVA